MTRYAQDLLKVEHRLTFQGYTKLAPQSISLLDKSGSLGMQYRAWFYPP